jgi:DNA-directed RNA polymerase specialized sigma24 family protein
MREKVFFIELFFLCLWRESPPMKKQTSFIPTKAESRQQRLSDEWAEMRKTYLSFTRSIPKQRVERLGLVFETIEPWLSRGIRTTMLRHFLVLPHEMLIARLFAKAVRRERIAPSHTSFLMWVESYILEGLADPSDALGVSVSAANEPHPELQYHFNKLAPVDRGLLYLYMIEQYSLPEVAKYVGAPAEEIGNHLLDLWSKLEKKIANVPLPRDWRLPNSDDPHLNFPSNHAHLAHSELHK